MTDTPTHPRSVRLDLRMILPAGATEAFDTELEYADLRARFDRLEAAEAAHTRRNTERRERYRAALAEHHAAADAAVLAGEAASEPPADPGPEPGRVELSNERHRIRSEVAEVWREHGATIAARIRDAAAADVREIDEQIAEHEATVRRLHERRYVPSQRFTRMREALARLPRPMSPEEDADDARDAAIVRSRYGGPLMPDGTPVEQAMQRQRSGRRRTR